MCPASLFFNSAVYLHGIPPLLLTGRKINLHIKRSTLYDISLHFNILKFCLWKYPQDYSVHYNNAVCLVICEGLHFTHIWKALA